MNTPELVEWQKLAPNGLVYPWWVHKFLDELETWDLKDKTWLEFGAGYSTAWLRSKCKWVDSIEANLYWSEVAHNYCGVKEQLNGQIFYPIENLPDGMQERVNEFFSLIPIGKQYDIISIDGIYRDECLEWAVTHFKGRDGILIVDNMDQDYVWISEKANKLMAPYPCLIYVQPDHFNNEGKPWNTRYYLIPS